MMMPQKKCKCQTGGELAVQKRKEYVKSNKPTGIEA